MCCLQEKSSGLTAAGRSDTLLLRQRGVVSPAMSTCWLKSLALPANMRNETFGITPKVFLFWEETFTSTAIGLLDSGHISLMALGGKDVSVRDKSRWVSSGRMAVQWPIRIPSKNRLDRIQKVGKPENKLRT